MKFLSIIRQGGISGYFILIWSILPYFIGRGRANPEDYAVIDTTALIQMGVMTIFFVYLLLNLKISSYRQILKYTFLKYLFIYIILCLISSIWSANPAYTFYRSFETLVMFFLIINLAYAFDFNYKRIANWAVIWGFFIGIVLYFIFVVKFRFNIHDLHGFGVVYITPLFFLPLIEKLNRKYFLLFLLCLIVATATKVYLGFIVAVLSMLYFKKTAKSLRVFLIISIAFILIGGFYKSEAIDLIFYGKSEANIKSGTGRLPVWEVLVEEAAKKPLLGYGFIMGERFASKRLGLRPVNAHNSFLAAMLGTGLVGVLVLLLFFIKSITLPVKMRKRQNAVLLIGCSVMAFVYSLFDNGIGTRLSTFWIAHMLLCTIIVSFYLVNHESSDEEKAFDS